LLLSGCVEDSGVSSESTINAESAEDYNIAAANNAFAFDMYSGIVNTSEGNMFFSPYSIFTAMAMCYDGAESTTKEEMSNVFYFPLNKNVLEISLREMIEQINSDNENYELETANALWIQQSFPVKEQYISNVETYYYGNVTNLDFVSQPEESKEEINNWVAEKTNDKIKDPISDGVINEYTRLIITNAVYFNGKWLTEFNEGSTRKRDFYISEDDDINVETMYTKQYFSYSESSDAKMLELPYKGDNLCMYVVLPTENDIEFFESSFSVSDYEDLKSDMDSEYEVKTWLPKFKFESRTELSDQLIRMGVRDAFSDQNADLSGISDEYLKISKVLHQAFVDVQEKGTEAAAATEVIVEDEAVDVEPIPEREFRADHPFMFFIEDKRTGCILFMGKVESPEYEETE
jgi:serpin B